MATHQLQPLQKAERVQLLDVLRGFAIFGIFTLNLYSFTFYFAYTDAEKSAVIFSELDKTTEFLHHMLLEGKFYSIFSLLFGIGFAVYLAKAGQQQRILPLFKRRLTILLAIGILHLLLWVGDIVTLYALLGFILIPFRRFSNKTLLIISAASIFSPIVLYALKMLNPVIFNPGQYLVSLSMQLDARQGITSERALAEALSGHDFLRMLQLNLHGILWRFGDLLIQDRIFKVFGMFLLGLVVGRTQFYNRLHQNKKLLWRLVFAGLVIGLPANYFMTHFMMKGVYYQLTANGLHQTIAYALGVAPLALAYASGIALLYQHPTAKRLLHTLAPVGRMALTNYIMHTIIGLLFFTQLGLGLQNMGPTAWSLFAVCVFIAQIFISTIWLRYFNYGPLEWLWRSATYGKWQPFIRRQPPPEVYTGSMAD